jgi:ubiquinone/menaquinone biosynthesis C-methylase UbiE
MLKHGTLNKKYHSGRKKKRALRYRLQRRAKEVVRSIKTYYSGIPRNIIDLGTADGLMLGIIKKKFLSARCVGVEYSRELVETNTDRRITLVQGDVNFLPVTDDCFDIVIATAIIEHVPDPERMLKEAKRILKPDGLIILTSPDPFWEHLATMVGHLPHEQHHNVMKLRELVVLFNRMGFDILEKTKFMLSPVGMPLEIPIEKCVRNMGLNALFANQLLVGIKKDN